MKNNGQQKQSIDYLSLKMVFEQITTASVATVGRLTANVAFGEHSKLAIRDSSDRKNWAKHYSLFFCISLTILCTIYPFVFTSGWSERPSVKANDTETWMQCNTFGTDFHLIQNGTTAVLPSDSTHFSISLQWRHSPGFCSRSRAQLPHEHLWN